MPKNQHTQRNFENFENWTKGEASVACKNQSFFKVDFVFPNKNYCDKLVQKCLQLFSKENDTFSDLIQLDNFGDRKDKKLLSCAYENALLF